MKLIFSIILSLLCISASVKADLTEKCKGSVYNGTCTYLDNCAYFLNMAQHYEAFGLTHEQVMTVLREANCGYIKMKVLVCCPVNSIANPQAPVTIPPNSNSDGSEEHGLISKPADSSPTSSPNTNSQSSTSATHIPTISNNPSTEAPPSNGLPTRPHTVGTVSGSGFANKPTTQVYGNEKPTETTTPAAPQTNPSVIIDEKLKLLPEECGRVLTFKYFHGNRTEFDDFPWTTLIEYETPSGKKFACGGALIHNRYVLTAAHCVTDLLPSWKISGVRFGEYDTDTENDCLPDGPNMTICNDKPIDVTVEEAIVHPQYNAKDAGRPHDIALLRLSASVNFTDVVKPICLPTKNPFPQRYYTTGWGKDFGQNLGKDPIRNGTNLKYMSYVSLMDQKSCEKKYTEAGVKISKGHLCGGARPTEKPCIGDGGGPLMGLEEIVSLEKRVTAFGILSLKTPATGDCQTSDYPAVYTKVLDYMSWILEQLKE